MRLNDDEFYRESKRGRFRIIAGCIGALFSVTLILGIVLYLNRDNAGLKKKSAVRVEEEEVVPPDPLAGLDGPYTGSGRTSDDLDFWNMYDKDTDEPEEEVPEKDETDYVKEILSANGISDNNVRGAVESDSDGETYNCADTGEEMIQIDPDIPRNSYVADGFRQEGNELQYYFSNRRISTYGIDLSKYQGRVDWEKLSEQGLDFVMIRMGVRGYSTGTVVYDEEFENNIKGANEHGIEAGLFFYSQALTAQEAEEEANYAVASAAAHKVTYPIVFYSEEVAGERARTDDLSPEERTALAKCFCDKVRSYGYKAMVGGSKHTLSVRLCPGMLTDYDVWLVDAPFMDEGDSLKLSEYPYQYTMWQYSSSARLDGIEGPADLDICFVDYRYR